MDKKFNVKICLSVISHDCHNSEDIQKYLGVPLKIIEQVCSAFDLTESQVCSKNEFFDYESECQECQNVKSIGFAYHFSIPVKHLENAYKIRFFLEGLVGMLMIHPEWNASIEDDTSPS